MFDAKFLSAFLARHDNSCRNVAALTLLLCFAGFYLSLFLPVRLKSIEGLLPYALPPLLIGLRWRDLKSFHRSLAFNVFWFLLVYLFLSHQWSQSGNTLQPDRLLRALVHLYGCGLAIHLIISTKITTRNLVYVWLAGTALILAATLCCFYWQHPFSARLEGYGRFFNSNAVATLAAGSLAIALANYGISNKAEKIILILTGSVFLLCIMFSHSRSGLMALIVTGAVVIVLNKEWKMMAIWGALLVSLVAITGTDIWTERGTSFRLDIWRINWPRLQECGMVFGCGLGTNSGAIINDTPVVHIHSIPFGTLFYGGLIAFIPYAAIIIYALFAAFRQSTRSSAGLLLIAGCIGTLFNRHQLLLQADPVWVYLIGPLLVIFSQEINNKKNAAASVNNPVIAT